MRRYADFIREAHSHEVDTNEFTNALELRMNALAGLSPLGIPEEIIVNAKISMNSFPKTNTFHMEILIPAM